MPGASDGWSLAKDLTARGGGMVRFEPIGLALRGSMFYRAPVVKPPSPVSVSPVRPDRLSNRPSALARLTGRVHRSGHRSAERRPLSGGAGKERHGGWSLMLMSPAVRSRAESRRNASPPSPESPPRCIAPEHLPVLPVNTFRHRRLSPARLRTRAWEGRQEEGGPVAVTTDPPISRPDRSQPAGKPNGRHCVTTRHEGQATDRQVDPGSGAPFRAGHLRLLNN